MATKIRPDEITSVIKQRLEQFGSALAVEEVGTVLEVGDGIARIYGLSKAMAGEMLDFGKDVFGIALNLEEDSIGAVILGDYLHISEGDEVKRTGRIIEVPVGEALVGRVVNPLGQPMDDGGPIKSDKFRPLEFKAPGIIERQTVNEPLQTGIKAIDSMIPV
ncbi:MAG: F0F1 ATP synthase subunit alpha, partial [Gemmatimonadetes bacterium]|nr:F0F1 ATP synthase subunit alpha [Gemmatimonadota bacterium]